MVLHLFVKSFTEEEEHRWGEEEVYVLRRFILYKI